MKPMTRFPAVIASILDDGREMAISTLRPDGWPQTTIVNFVLEGDRVLFGCPERCQKVRNLDRDSRTSLSVRVGHCADQTAQALGAADHAQRLTEPHEILRVVELMADRFPDPRERLCRDRGDYVFFAIKPFAVTPLRADWGLQSR